MYGNPEADELRRIYARVKRIAVVGASKSEGKKAHDIPEYLQSQGYDIVPVNPGGGEILGVPAVTGLAEIDGPIDVVDVFRPPEEARDVAAQAIASGAGILWFQPDTDTDEAVDIARGAGLTVVRGICMGETHKDLGLTR